MEVVKTEKSRIAEMEAGGLGFGRIFSDHMLDMEFRDGSWREPRIVPYGTIGIPPSMIYLHYGQAVFDGLKAFYTKDGSIQLFRAERHQKRFNGSCERLCIPTVEAETFIGGISALVDLDRKWVPKRRGESLYIRPFVFAADEALGVRVSDTYRYMVITSPVGAYFEEGFDPVRLVTSGGYVRAVKGGLGEAKTPANYAASLLPGEEAKKKGFSQVLWLDGCGGRYIDEVGSMNVFFLIGDELITPPLTGAILEGVTRDSVIRIARDWGIEVSERAIAIDELLASHRDGALREAFGTGTAAVVSPVGEIVHGDDTIVVNDGNAGELSIKLFDEITGIQYGEKPDRYGWCTPI